MAPAPAQTWLRLRWFGWLVSPLVDIDQPADHIIFSQLPPHTLKQTLKEASKEIGKDNSKEWSLSRATDTPRTGLMSTITPRRRCQGACPTSPSRRMPSSGGSQFMVSTITRYHISRLLKCIRIKIFYSDKTSLWKSFRPARVSWR